jgi:hypothetical protein
MFKWKVKNREWFRMKKPDAEQYRWFTWPTFLALLIAFSMVGLVIAQNPNERMVKPGPSPQDKDEINKKDGKIWVLDFKFKDPRLVKVDIPGRGQKVCWYLTLVENQCLLDHLITPLVK